MKKFLIPTAILFCAFFISCSESDEGINTNQSPNITTYEKTTSSTTDGQSYLQKVTAPLVNNKFFGFSYEDVVDGEITNSQEIENFQYEDNLLVQIIPEDRTNEMVTHLFYDLSGQLVGAELSSEVGFEKFYRIVQVSEHVNYLEVINQPHTDPNASIINRYIVELDDHYNIVKAGRDQDLDGTMESEKIFTYINNNLTAIQMNGTVENISYSSIKDTKRFVLDQSEGKKVARIKWAEAVVLASSVERILDIQLSENLTVDQANAATYEVADNGFYIKKTTLQGDTSETIEFIFE